ncbi:hypothetical protein V7S52_08655 [Agromyces sp. CCNWLW208]
MRGDEATRSVDQRGRPTGPSIDEQDPIRAFGAPDGIAVEFAARCHDHDVVAESFQGRDVATVELAAGVRDAGVGDEEREADDVHIGRGFTELVL